MIYVAELSALRPLSLLFLTQYHRIGPVTPVREPRPKDEKELAQSHTVRNRVCTQADPPRRPAPQHQTLGVFSVPAQCSLEPAGGEGDRRVCQAWGTLGDSRTLLQTQAAPAKREALPGPS